MLVFFINIVGYFLILGGVSEYVKVCPRVVLFWEDIISNDFRAPCDIVDFLI